MPHACYSVTYARTVLIIAGTTAVGKTDLSICLAKRLNGEVISADSVQVPCVCMCVCLRALSHMHTHTHIHNACVCVSMCTTSVYTQCTWICTLILESHFRCTDIWTSALPRLLKTFGPQYHTTCLMWLTSHKAFQLGIITNLLLQLCRLVLVSAG